MMTEAYLVLLVFGALGIALYFLAQENDRLRQNNTELIDRMVFNRQPERIVAARAKQDEVAPVLTTPDRMGDPYSVAERKAEEAAEGKV